MQINAFRWLDEPAGWFTIQGIAKHGLPKAIDKVLAVAGEVTVPDCHAGLEPESALVERTRCRKKCSWNIAG